MWDQLVSFPNYWFWYVQVNELSLACSIVSQDIGNIWKVISSHISIASQRSKRFIAELPLRAGANVHFVNSLDVHTFMNCVWALNWSSAIRCFERSNAIKICDGITFDFYVHGTATNISIHEISHQPYSTPGLYKAGVRWQRSYVPALQQACPHNHINISILKCLNVGVGDSKPNIGSS